MKSTKRGSDLKLPFTPLDAVRENEYLMLAQDRVAGIEMPKSRLALIAAIEGPQVDAACLEGIALTVQLFDRRPKDQRIHIEAFAEEFGVFPEANTRSGAIASVASML